MGEWKRGEIATRVKYLDDIPLLPTPNGLMKTGFDYLDGKTGAQKAGGFKPKADAKAINWIIMARNAPIAPCKQDAVRIFDPSTWQKSRAWHGDYRKYFDLWIPENKLDGVFANIGA